MKLEKREVPDEVEDDDCDDDDDDDEDDEGSEDDREPFAAQSLNLDGLNSGVPTRTTPTLTPTTLRSIEQTFIELQCQTERHTNQAGFVPPPVSAEERPPPHALPPVAPSPPAPPVRRRGMGGRRPNNAQSHLSPEEEERRNVRRERNKMAAARCRKRRLDHTNDLEEETKGLERKKQTLQEEIRQLQQDRDELQFILDTHRACCRMRAAHDHSRRSHRAALHYADVRIKEETEDVDAEQPVPDPRLMLSSANRVVPPRPSRPSFLDVPAGPPPPRARTRQDHVDPDEVAGVPITTPSAGIPFNFDSLMEGGTGLTPVQPCATQQVVHRPHPEAAPPDSPAPSKLVSL